MTHPRWMTAILSQTSITRSVKPMASLQGAPTASWKVTQFLTNIDLDKSHILLLYSGLAGRLIEIPESYRERAETILRDPNSSTAKSEEALHRLFQDQGILIPEEWDELSLLKYHHQKSRATSSGHLGLTICPTINCNYRCKYCYEDHIPGLMSESVQDKVIEYIENHTPALTSLSVTWFGGEPLLALSIIERLSKRFIELQKKEIKYEASIITNGWLLKKDVSSLLHELQITNAQITIDGPREIHDERRPLVGNHPTFDRIVENIALSDPNLRITVRVNTDFKNIESMPMLFDQLDNAGLQGKISIYFAPVIPYTSVCTDVASECISGYSWSKAQVQLQVMALERGYGGMGLPQPKSNVCMADGNKGFVISPNGLVYKCWSDVTDPEKAVFDLMTQDQTASMLKNVERWRNWTPFNFSDCSGCQVLPLCMGGCPYLSQKNNSGNCSELKFNLRERLITYYFAFKRRKAANQLIEKLNQLFPEVSLKE